MKKTGLADSPFFKQPDPKSEQTNVQSNEQPEIRTNERTNAFPPKRTVTRYSFDFYADQILKIKRIKFEAEQAGQKVTLSDIARLALDEYLKNK